MPFRAESRQRRSHRHVAGVGSPEVVLQEGHRKRQKDARTPPWWKRTSRRRTSFVPTGCPRLGHFRLTPHKQPLPIRDMRRIAKTIRRSCLSRRTFSYCAFVHSFILPINSFLLWISSFRVNALCMCLGGAFGNEQFIGNFRQAVALRKKLDYFDFALRQFILAHAFAWTLAAEFAALSRALSLEFGCFRNANTPNATTTKAIKENKTINTSVSNDSSPSSGKSPEPRAPLRS